MRIERNGGTIYVSGIEDLDASIAAFMRRALAQEMADNVREIAVDLSETRYADCGGLGALVALRKLARDADTEVRLVRPRAVVLRLLALTRLESSFPVVEPAFAA